LRKSFVYGKNRINWYSRKNLGEFRLGVNRGLRSQESGIRGCQGIQGKADRLRIVLSPVTDTP